MFWGCFLPSVFGSVYCTVLILFYTAWYLLNRIEANLCLADLSLLDCTWKLVMLNLYLVICDLVIEDLFICRLYLVTRYKRWGEQGNRAENHGLKEQNNKQTLAHDSVCCCGQNFQGSILPNRWVYILSDCIFQEIIYIYIFLFI